MPRARNVNLEDVLTPEQNVDASGLGLPDLYFLMVPRQTIETLNIVAKKQKLTVAEALGHAVDMWIRGVDNG